MSSPTYEKGIVVGNTYDKYGTRNPIARLIVRRFLRAFDELVSKAEPTRVLEVGCGPGDLSLRLARNGMDVLAADISGQMVQLARDRAREEGLSVQFCESDLFDLEPESGPACDLVICCEVLEHLEEPRAAISHLARLTRRFLLFSVPREPAWRVLNILRGSYWSELGNTPGHLQHWSRRDFLQLLRAHVEIVSEPSPFPWTMALCRVSDRQE